MNTEIFIVSCGRHFPWLEYCLKSIDKYATGFSGVTVLIPAYDLDAFMALGLKLPSTNLKIRVGDEWTNKGMLWHMAMVMNADEWCPEADFILHTDSDCVFSEPVTPDDYFKDGKPILYHERFKSLGAKHPDVLRWQEVVQACVTFPVTQETMRRHPAVHPRKVYKQSRKEIEKKTNKPWDQYIFEQRNEFPQSFCEFVTLGNVGMRYFPNEYCLYDTEKNSWPHQKIVQFSSGNSPMGLAGLIPPTVVQHPVYKGKPFSCTPDYFLT
jgi:hypothetical protein